MSRADEEEPLTATHVARALVAACRITGEIGRLEKLAEDRDAFVCATLKGRWLALAGLELCWPRRGRSRLAPLVGVGSKRAADAGMVLAKRSPNFNDQTIGRVWAAI